MEISKIYNPAEIEEKWYEFWEKNNLFASCPNNSKKPYTIVIPPPNITGILTMGHVLNNTLQDILIRWKRMSGYETCWVPGTDHAGIATQNVVEKSLAKNKLFKRDIGREKFIEHVWKWKEEYGGTIIRQLKRLGCSCDWSRERFTLDEGLSNAVREVFVRLYNRGLIYRGKYIVNWCPRCTTALSDDEVDYREHDGSLWCIKYPIKQIKGAKNYFITVATTRPETMLGDTAVAVNPQDTRFKDIVGSTVILPLVNREIPVIADPFVDPQFGTGIVKVTPAHDPNDFQIGLRHNLEQIIVFDITGKMNDNVPSVYRNLDRYECRKKVVEDLQSLDMILKVEKHANAIGHCYRCDTVIEPYLSDQWFVKMKPLAEKALEVVLDGKIQFSPERWLKVYQHWMENIKDWCISRQLWWGHRIPVYYCRQKGCPPVVSTTKPDKCPKCGSKELEQDPDVLDTWFSSWLWPFSTLGWPQDTKDLKYYYPTDTLVTAADIIFFWVARMIMAGLEFMGEVPFSKVYFNSMVRDSHGRKMSKSLGNSPDPLDIMKEYSADALRFTVTYLTPVGQDVLFAREKCEIGRNFCNKIWNAARFIQMNLNSTPIQPLDSIISRLEVMDKWIISEFNSAIKNTTRALEEFNFTEAAHSLYDFFWSEFCDWYLELTKPRLKAESQSASQDKVVVMSVLVGILTEYLKLLHPLMPHITEEIFQQMSQAEDIKPDRSIVIASWPKYDEEKDNPGAVREVEFLIEVIKNLRNVRTDMNIQPKELLEIIVNSKDQDINEVFRKYLPNLTLMTKIKNVTFGKSKQKHSASIALKDVEIYMPLEGIIEFEKEKKRLQKKYDELKQANESLEIKLKNPEFLAKAPEKEIIKLKEYHKENNNKLFLLLQYLEVL